MRQRLVAGNWKMNGNRAEAEALVRAIVQGSGTVGRTTIAICPPAILIPLVSERLAATPIKWGGQDLNQFKSGAYTGEISGPMLRDYGCTYVIVGHSERRTIYRETDDLVAEKFKSAQDAGLTPILCVGETLAERESNQTEAVVERQLAAVIQAAGIQSLQNAVIAYEPVWAIGTGKVASPEQAQAVHAFIRARLAKDSKDIAAQVCVLYGGSVKGSNAGELFGQPDIDGGLIGGASLAAEEFLTICRAAD